MRTKSGWAKLTITVEGRDGFLLEPSPERADALRAAAAHAAGLALGRPDATAVGEVCAFGRTGEPCGIGSDEAAVKVRYSLDPSPEERERRHGERPPQPAPPVPA